jgi:Taurine catabolism dioxygenase TauD, TfdA family
VSYSFDLFDNSPAPADYLAWREHRLAAYPATVETIRVAVTSLANPSMSERRAIAQRIAAYNMALITAPPDQVTPEAILAFGRVLGLRTADSNLFADHRAISTIAAHGGGDRADYIPYTNKPLSWHTDGYYNGRRDQVHAWTLFCLRPAASGGVNGLLDPEVAYIHLRDQSPDLIRALAHPKAFIIPANLREGRVLRPESAGPVFSVAGGRLHMRYSARQRNVTWRATPEVQAARQALDRLFSTAGSYIFSHRLEAGEGFVTNNVLHNRSGFEDLPTPGEGRLLYRVRYREPIDCREMR